MLEERLLKILIRKTLKEELKLRTRKGYGVSHPIVNHKPFMKGLGKSDYEEEPDQKKQEDQSPVKVSKAFESDPLDDLREYQQIIEELLYAT